MMPVCTKLQIEVDGKNVMLSVMDTAGQEELSSMRDQWIKHGEGFLCAYVYDIVPNLC